MGRSKAKPKAKAKANDGRMPCAVSTQTAERVDSRLEDLGDTFCNELRQFWSSILPQEVKMDSKGRHKWPDGRCRQYALAVALAQPSASNYTWSDFEKHCLEFDRENPEMLAVAGEFSRQYFAIGEAPNFQNIFSFVLERQGLKSIFICPKEGSSVELREHVAKGDISRIIMFSFQHAWAVRVLDAEWYEFGSGSNRHSLPKLVTGWEDGLGYVCIQDLAPLDMGVCCSEPAVDVEPKNMDVDCQNPDDADM